MFAALMTVRLREAVAAATEGLFSTKSWMSADDVSATELPLAKATEKTLASMHAVLAKTAASRAAELAEEPKGIAEDEKAKHLRITRAAEVRVVRYVDDLRNPRRASDSESGPSFSAVAISLDSGSQAE